MSKKYTSRFLKENEASPLRVNISAVFLVAFQDGKVLSIQNERGWDIPCGHLEGEEQPFVALQREVFEEGRCGGKQCKAVCNPLVVNLIESDVILCQ